MLECDLESFSSERLQVDRRIVHSEKESGRPLQYERKTVQWVRVSFDELRGGEENSPRGRSRRLNKIVPSFACDLPKISPYRIMSRRQPLIPIVTMRRLEYVPRRNDKVVALTRPMNLDEFTSHLGESILLPVVGRSRCDSERPVEPRRSNEEGNEDLTREFDTIQENVCETLIRQSAIVQLRYHGSTDILLNEQSATIPLRNLNNRPFYP